LKDYYGFKQGFENNEPKEEIVGEVAYQRADSTTIVKQWCDLMLARMENGELLSL